MALTNGPKLGLVVNGEQGETHYAQLMRLWRGLDALIQLTVKGHTGTAPPGSPSDGDCYVLPTTPSGDWEGHGGEVARWDAVNEAWEFYPAKTGWIAWSDETNRHIYRAPGGAWANFPPPDVPEVEWPEVGPNFAFAYQDAVLDIGNTRVSTSDPYTPGASANGFPAFNPSNGGYIEYSVPTTDLNDGTEVYLGFITEAGRLALEAGTAWLVGYSYPWDIPGESFSWRGDGRYYRNNSMLGTTGTFSNSDKVGLAIDFTLGKVWLLVNGVATSGDPVARTGGFDISTADTLYPFVGIAGMDHQVTMFPNEGDQDYPVSGMSSWAANPPP